MLKKGKIKNILKEDDLYPEVSNPDFSSKIYKKREFYFHKIPQRKKLTDYEEIKKYRNDACSKEFKPKDNKQL